MAKVLIVTDSASDISIEDEKLYGIKVLPFKVALGDKSYISRIDFNNEKFYEMMANFGGLPSTSQITTFQFQEFYEEKCNEGYTDLVMVLINKEGSATFTNAVYAEKLFYQDNPEWVGKINIHLFDGRSYSAGYGEAVIGAAIMNQNGQSVEEICRYLDDKLSKSMIYFGMYSLKYAAKSGRIPSAAAFVGEALGLKPLMKIYDHKITTYRKIRGERLLIPSIVECVLDEMAENTPYTVLYGSDKTVGTQIAKLMEEKVGYPPIRMTQIGAAIAINAGPKVVGIRFDKRDL